MYMWLYHNTMASMIFSSVNFTNDMIGWSLFTCGIQSKDSTGRSSEIVAPIVLFIVHKERQSRSNTLYRVINQTYLMSKQVWNKEKASRS